MPPNQAALGPLIAVIGCDGSGKSTVSQAVLEWARGYGPAAAAHLGKQSGNIGRVFTRLPLVGGAIARLIARKADGARTLRDKSAPGPLTALVVYALSLRALSRFKRMMALRRRGLIVVTDRYPQLDVPGAYDGPGLSTSAPGGAMVRWLARREHAFYLWMTGYRPDLVLRLNVDLDTAYARKPDHRYELLREKVAATPLLKFNGAPIADIDATQPLPEVLAAARTVVLRALAERGYRAS